MLTDKTKQAILSLQKLYPEKRSALIPSLHLAQSEKGYLPLDTQKEVADLFDIDANEINSLVTFYDMFFDKPTGKHVIHACKNVSCMLRGADGVIAKMCQKLNVKPHETTLDGEFTIIPSECLGACDLAPVMIVDDKLVGPVKVEDIDHVLSEAKKGPGHPSPIKIEDVSHA